MREAVWVSADGEVETLSLEAAAERLRRGAVPIVCHARAVARRLRLTAVDAYDVLELFAFVRPARFCVPTPRGLAQALLLPLPRRATRKPASSVRGRARPAGRADRLTRAGSRLPSPGAWPAAAGAGRRWCWRRWAPATQPPAAGRTRSAARLAAAEGVGGGRRPSRRRTPGRSSRSRRAPGWSSCWATEPSRGRSSCDYASHVAAAFAPREQAGEPRLVLAEAGTGIGKTLGYIAPATLWAQKNHGAVWISTYTRNLQRQLDRRARPGVSRPAVRKRAR